MVFYCCVGSCRIKGNKKNRRAVTFHPFPSSPLVRAKWLTAIGREHWEPPSTTRVCSKHFTADVIRRNGSNATVAEDAVPTLRLPCQSNSALGPSEPSELVVCRVCLTTETRMVCLQRLQTCVDAIAPYCNNFTMDGVPQVVCYLCAAQLVKCYKFLTMCQTAQDALTSIFRQHGTITKSLVKNQSKIKKITQIAPLQIQRVTSIFDYKYDEEKHASCLISSPFIKHDKSLKVEGPLEVTDVPIQNLDQKGIKAEVDLYDEMAEPLPMDTQSTGSGFDSEDDKALVPSLKNLMNEDCVLPVLEEKYLDRKKQSIESGKKAKMIVEKGLRCKNKRKERSLGRRKELSDLSPNEMLLEEHFNIIRLTLEEQIADWRSTTSRRSQGKRYPCAVCSKGYMQLSAYQTHLASHDPSRGPASCPVCKLRYKSDVLVRSHVKFSHSKKYHCKTCAKTFNTLCMALRHHKQHSGRVYRCSLCSFTSAHEALLGAHRRRRHPVRAACARCGRGFATPQGLRLHQAKAHATLPLLESESSDQYKCEECELSFSSEGALTVHRLTSFQHKKQRNLLDPNAGRTCKRCGVQFGSRRELVLHCGSAHGATQGRSDRGRYPIDCQHCEARLNSRKEHWDHVRQSHPKQRASYQPVITAVCETCGKGFQNTTKLQLHELRHASPTVRCELCGKLFYDRFRLSEHLATHRETFPHRCTVCGRGFKAQPNLSRHYKTHTDIAAYECTLCGKKFKYSTSLNLHVRSVHYKIPLPPRKKRTRTKHSVSAASVGVVNDKL